MDNNILSLEIQYKTEEFTTMKERLKQYEKEYSNLLAGVGLSTCMSVQEISDARNTLFDSIEQLKDDIANAEKALIKLKYPSQIYHTLSLEDADKLHELKTRVQDFQQKVANNHECDYIEFSHACEELAKFELACNII